MRYGQIATSDTEGKRWQPLKALSKRARATHRSRPVEVVASQWIDPDNPPVWVCMCLTHSKRRGTAGIGSPHVHLSRFRKLYNHFEFVEAGDWFVREYPSGGGMTVLDDATFQRRYEPIEEAADAE